MTTPTSPPYKFAYALQGANADKPTASAQPQDTLYWATDTTTLYISDGSAWNAVGGGGGGLPSWFQSGSGSPVGVVTPAQAGALYQDTTNGGLYEALDVTSADWVGVGGITDATVAGIDTGGIGSGGDTTVIALSGGRVVLTDVDALAGFGNCVTWVSDGSDGDQSFVVKTGSAGQYTALIQDGAGNMVLPGPILTAPPASTTSSLALGSAFHNVNGYDELLIVILNITVNTTGVIKLGVGSTSTPTQQTIATGVTSTGFMTVPIYLPNAYYALLSTTGTITLTIAGQMAMPV